MTDSVLHIYLATDLTPVAREMHGPEETHMEVLRLPLAEAVEMVARGEINDAKTVIGLLLVDRRLREGNLAPASMTTHGDAAAGGRGVPVVDGHRARPIGEHACRRTAATSRATASWLQKRGGDTADRRPRRVGHVRRRTTRGRWRGVVGCPPGRRNPDAAPVPRRGGHAPRRSDVPTSRASACRPAFPIHCRRTR